METQFVNGCVINQSRYWFLLISFFFFNFWWGKWSKIYNYIFIKFSTIAFHIPFEMNPNHILLTMLNHLKHSSHWNCKFSEFEWNILPVHWICCSKNWRGLHLLYLPLATPDQPPSLMSLGFVFWKWGIIKMIKWQMVFVIATPVFTLIVNDIVEILVIR